MQSVNGDVKVMRLRSLVTTEFLNAGWAYDESRMLKAPEVTTKQEMRDFHRAQRHERAVQQIQLFREKGHDLLEWFANGEEIKPAEFAPRLLAVPSSGLESELFRFATMLWSVPVSQGYGRRMRYLVIDESNHKLVGLFALGDPVFNLKVRDNHIGWNSEQRKSRLYHLMDSYVLGAVPPYNQLLCGKLIALLTVSDPVRKDFEQKYEGKRTVIQGAVKDASLVLVTTTSALGRSSIYNRIQMPDESEKVFRSIGFSEGWGHFHISDTTFNELRIWLRDTQEKSYADKHKYGSGPNWRLRTIRQALDLLGFDGHLLRHGIKREVFLAPLASNYREYLTDDGSVAPNYYQRGLNQIAHYFRNRWMLPRSQRTQEWRDWTREATLNLIREQTGITGDPLAPKQYSLRLL